MIKLQNLAQLQKYIKEQSTDIENATIYAMEYLVDELVTHAKTHPGYNDITGNLKSSIVGVVLKEGVIIKTKAEGTQTGIETSTNYINSLIGSYSKGLVILVAAGMQYASYVENYRNKNVLRESEFEMNKKLPEMLEMLKKLI